MGADGLRVLHQLRAWLAHTEYPRLSAAGCEALAVPGDRGAAQRRFSIHMGQAAGQAEDCAFHLTQQNLGRLYWRSSHRCGTGYRALVDDSILAAAGPVALAGS